MYYLSTANDILSEKVREKFDKQKRRAEARLFTQLYS